jgi:hypothetical protein
VKTGLTVAGKRHVFQGVRNRPRRSEDRFESHEVQRARTLRRCPPPQTGHFLYRCVGDRGTRINDTMPEEISQWPIARRRIRRTLCRFRCNRPGPSGSDSCMAQPLRVSPQGNPQTPTVACVAVAQRESSIRTLCGLLLCRPSLGRQAMLFVVLYDGESFRQ